ncbi:MAG: peptide chain release factor N(5)-glutamine methyltransferase [Candidatus Omnitrophica bacterium]|nr:peptide chain release factor N(5)-glutamine methyltransferase [Candidatus Omnitrophota bacterium]
MSRHPRLVQEGARRLKAAGLSHARYEAEWLLGRLTGTGPLELYLREGELPSGVAERFLSQVEARAAGAPLQYLLGEADFCGAPFVVRPGVFIPRPETESVVEQALQALRARQARIGAALRLLDLGTGSGCIAVTLARALPACVVVGVELSWEALCVARQNVLRYGLASRVQLVQGCWTEPLRGTFDGVIANPPYIPSATVDHLPLDVRQEPRVSLDGGDDGMRDLGTLVAQAPRLLAPGGILALECGEEQAAPLAAAVTAAGWAQGVRLLRDLAQRPRGVLMMKVGKEPVLG